MQQETRLAISEYTFDALINFNRLAWVRKKKGALALAYGAIKHIYGMCRPVGGKRGRSCGPPLLSPSRTQVSLWWWGGVQAAKILLPHPFNVKNNPAGHSWSPKYCLGGSCTVKIKDTQAHKTLKKKVIPTDFYEYGIWCLIMRSWRCSYNLKCTTKSLGAIQGHWKAF